MRLHPLHPAQWVLDQLHQHGWHTYDLLAFTRSSTLVLAYRGDQEPVVVKAGFGSNHVLAALPAADRPAAYGFYWYQQMSPEERALTRADFQHELDLTRAATGTPHLVPLLDYGHCDDFDWYTMPYYPDGNFRAVLVAKQPVAQYLSILADVASGLAELHARGIVHRDVYQENILLHRGRGLLTDLGAARRLGTPRGPRHRGPETHWPPEYLTNYADAGPAADVYSLAVLTYRTLVGDIPRPTLPMPTDTPTQLRDLLNAALAHIPADRPPMTCLRDILRHAAAQASAEAKAS
ncbi:MULTISPECIES: protein kinase domain-containing protein [Nocardia]|uniref:protein kinase domain-containing protein n=1 Tax=Nocardia TaxID=1817 RepID=UPI00255C6555|nr:MULTISPECIES: protein kinase [Nocardia]